MCDGRPGAPCRERLDADRSQWGMGRKQATAHVEAWTQEHVGSQERERFREVAEVELSSLHEGKFARYQIRPTDFTAWREVRGK
jgi:hypothetical protein